MLWTPDGQGSVQLSRYQRDICRMADKVLIGGYLRAESMRDWRWNGQGCLLCHADGNSTLHNRRSSADKRSAGVFLISALPEQDVALLGEPAKTPIQILPFWKYPEFPEHSFDLVLNQDSLPEMGQEAAVAYIEQTAEKSAYFFLSIN